MCVKLKKKPFRETKKYVEFLTLSETPYKNDSKFDANNFAHNPGDIVYKILGVDEQDAGKTSPNIILNRKCRVSEGGGDETASTSTATPIENLANVKSLLSQEDSRGHEHESKNLLHSQMKKITNSSFNLLNKKMAARKPKQADGQKEKDIASKSLESYSDFSRYTPVRAPKSAASEIKDFFKGGFLKHSAHHKAKEGAGMATLLVRTVMAPPSDVTASPKEHTHHRKHSHQHDVHHHAPDNLASTPTDVMTSEGNLSSNFTDSTCSMTSSSDEAEEKSNAEQKEIVLIDADTVSMVVKSVLAQDEAEQDDNSWIQPSNDPNDSEDDEAVDIAHRAIVEPRRLFRRASFHGTDHHTEELCRSIKSGATRIVGPNKKGSHTQAIIFEKDTNPEMLENFLSTSPDDNDEVTWIQPGSTTDEPDFDDTHSSLFHDWKENISGKFHSLQEHMHHHGHHPHQRKEIKHKHGLLATAMDTILLEQAEMLGAQVGQSPALSDLLREEKRSGSYDSLKKFFHLPFHKHGEGHHHDEQKSHLKTTGLVDMAMKTMLTETANIIEGVGVHPESEPAKQKQNARIEQQLSTSAPTNIELPERHDRPEPQPNQFTEPAGDDRREDTAAAGSAETQTFAQQLAVALEDALADATPITHSTDPGLNPKRRNKSMKMPVSCSDSISNRSFERSQSISHNIRLSHHHQPHQHPHSHLSKELCVNPFSIYKNTNSSPHKHNLIDLNAIVDHNNTNQYLLHASNSLFRHRNGNVLSPSSSHASSRNDSSGPKGPQSPTKGPANADPLPTAGSKDASGRRSSDSELSVTPKGRHSFINRTAQILPNFNLIYLVGYLLRC